MDTKTIIGRIAVKCLERNQQCADVGGKGQKAALNAVSFFVGAANMAEINGQQELVDHLTKVIIFSVSLRGMEGVKELAAWSD